MLNPDDKYIIVNYHYVRDPDPKWGGIHPCPVGDFQKHIAFLKKNFEITDIAGVYQAAKTRKPGRFCAITFDDGFRDNYENALPILKKHNAIGTFFIIGGTLEGRMPLTHKLHVLFSVMSAGELIDSFNQWAAGAYIIPKDHSINNRRKHGDMLTNNFKEAMILIDPRLRDGFVDHCFSKKGLDEARLVKDFFMPEELIKDLDRTGMLIGSHSHGHNSFEVLSAAEIKSDLLASRAILEKITGKKINTFSYPHGRYSDQTLAELEAAGFDYAVTIDRRPVSSEDKPLLIPRYDANDLKID